MTTAVVPTVCKLVCLVRNKAGFHFLFFFFLFLFFFFLFFFSSFSFEHLFFSFSFFFFFSFLFLDNRVLLLLSCFVFKTFLTRIFLSLNKRFNLFAQWIKSAFLVCNSSDIFAILLFDPTLFR